MHRRKNRTSLPTVKMRSRQKLPTHISPNPKTEVSFGGMLGRILIAIFLPVLFYTHFHHHTSRPTTPLTISCVGFDHGDTSPISEVNSIFNCGSDSGTCKWYFPARFLDPFCGVGKKYNLWIEQVEKRRRAGTLWKNNPPIPIPHVSLNPNVDSPHPNDEDPFVFPTHNLSMIHVHKTGGTSLVTSFMDLHVKRVHDQRRTKKRSRQKKNEAVPIPIRRLAKGEQETLYSNNNGKLIENRDKVSIFLEGATKYKDSWGQPDHTMFAVVRDPVERFISQIGQVTAFRYGGNNFAEQLRGECMKETSAQTLSCFVSLVQTNSTWIDVHFTPQVIEIAFATMYKDIPVAIFPFTEVPSLLRELGGNPSEKIKDGHGKGYRSSDVFADMSVNDYDDVSLRGLCQIYEMDVLLMNHLGYRSMCNEVDGAAP